MSGQIFRINAPLVANQVIDGEAVIIHFETGCYYSTDGLGAAIFSRFENGADIDKLIEEVTGQFDAPHDDIDAAVRSFVDELKAESLLVAADTAGSYTPIANTDQSAFEPPKLQKYTDLQDLLLLDPIHDIEQEGWPRAKTDKKP